MNKKIILTLTAFSLATAGVFAFVKKVTASSLYAKNVAGTGSCFTITINTTYPAFTTSPGTGANQATIKSQNGTQYHFFSTGTCGSTHKVYFKP